MFSIPSFEGIESLRWDTNYGPPCIYSQENLICESFTQFQFIIIKEQNVWKLQSHIPRSSFQLQLKLNPHSC